MRTQEQQPLAGRAHIANFAARQIIADARAAGSLSVIPLRWYEPSDALESAIAEFNFESDSEEEDYYRSLPYRDALGELGHLTDSLLYTAAQREQISELPRGAPTIKDAWLSVVHAVEVLEKARYQSEVITRNPRQDYAPLPPGATVVPTVRATRARAAPAAPQAPVQSSFSLAQRFEDALRLPLPRPDA